MTGLIRTFFDLLALLVLAKVILSYFLSPYHQVRQFIDRIVDPMLDPIRKVVKPIGGMDFSPVVLLLIIQLISYLVLSLL